MAICAFLLRRTGTYWPDVLFFSHTARFSAHADVDFSTLFIPDPVRSLSDFSSFSNFSPTFF